MTDFKCTLTGGKFCKNCLVNAPWKRSLVYSPSILSHTSTDIWHRFQLQRPMFTTYWFQLFACRKILNQFLHIWYSLAISFTIKFESQKFELLLIFLLFYYHCVKKVKVVRFLQLKLCCAENSEDLKCKKNNWKVCKMEEVVW